MDRLFTYLTILLLLFPAADVAAQTPVPKDSTVMFNALDYSMQKRFRPKDEPFVSAKWMDNTYVSIFIGTMQIAPSAGNTCSWSPEFGASYGKWFNPFHSVRLGGTWDMLVRNADEHRAHNIGIDVSHLFNISSYLGGYRESRFCELYTVAGLGYRLSFMDGEANNVANVHAGFQANMKVWKNLDFFIEPVVRLNTNGLTHAGEWNWRRYNISYGGSMGLTWRLGHEEKPARPSAVPDGETFASVMAGAQFQHSDLVHETLGVGRSLGPHIALSYGKYYSDMFAVRASFSYASDKWTSYYQEPYWTHYTSLRTEGMFDIVAAATKGDGRPPVSCSVLFGPELGLMLKRDMNFLISRLYFGLTGGIQVKFRLLDYISLFVEPRFSVIPYSFPVNMTDPMERMRENFYDSVYNLNIGVEVRLPKKK